MRDLTSIDAAVNWVRGQPAKKREAAINDLLRGKLDWKTSQGRALLHRRALVCTALDRAKLWPER